jgi:hypothetical protein
MPQLEQRGQSNCARHHRGRIRNRVVIALKTKPTTAAVTKEDRFWVHNLLPDIKPELLKQNHRMFVRWHRTGSLFTEVSMPMLLPAHHGTV